MSAIFVPEHGWEGRVPVEAGERVDTPRIDKVSGARVYSLYGDTRKPTPMMLQDIDLLVFDIQDIGARFYTYISTMGLAMQAAAAARIPFLVLDRPNPLGGEYVSGYMMEDSQKSFVGQYGIPIVHGMTVGELAQLIAKERLLPGLEELELTVIPMEGWKRWMKWVDVMGRLWIKTSPNIRSFDAALLYPGIAFFEATSVNEGRGTDYPFRLLGAEWLDQPRLLAALNAKKLPGVAFGAVEYMPEPKSKLAVTDTQLSDKVLKGIRIDVVDYKSLMPLETGITVLQVFRDHGPIKGQPEIIDNVSWLNKLAGTKRLYEELSKGVDAKDIIASWKDEVEKFKAVRAKYLLYN